MADRRRPISAGGPRPPHEARQPRRWDRWLTTNYARRRVVRVGAQSLATVGRDHDVQVEFPLLDPGFLGALADAGGGAGYGDRTAMMRRLFGSVLPDDVNARPGKAQFGAVSWGPQARAFAQAWDGSGLDTDLVDRDRLREAWRRPSPPFGTGMLIQVIWLRSGGHAGAVSSLSPLQWGARMLEHNDELDDRRGPETGMGPEASYQRPEVRDLGTITDLTRGGDVGVDDLMAGDLVTARHNSIKPVDTAVILAACISAS